MKKANEPLTWYTATGDDGTTALLGDARVYKYHPQPETFGAVDEASASLGMARALASHPAVKDVLLTIQRDLHQMMSELAANTTIAHRFRTINADRVAWLEATMDSFGNQVVSPRGFVASGDTPAGAALDVARTIVRRAERRVVRLLDDGLCANREILRYLNRLSSLCFVMALLEDAAGHEDNTLAK